MTRTVRFGAPATLLAAGLVLVFAFGSRETEAAGYTLLGGSALMVLSTVIFRAGLASHVDREREEAARVFFDQHGRWPRRGELDGRFGSDGAGKDRGR